MSGRAVTAFARFCPLTPSDGPSCVEETGVGPSQRRESTPLQSKACQRPPAEPIPGLALLIMNRSRRNRATPSIVAGTSMAHWDCGRVVVLTQCRMRVFQRIALRVYDDVSSSRRNSAMCCRSIFPCSAKVSRAHLKLTASVLGLASALNRQHCFGVDSTVAIVSRS